MEKNRLRRISELLCIDITVGSWGCQHTVMTEPLMLSDRAGEGNHSFKVETTLAAEMYDLQSVDFAVNEERFEGG